jgi:hypothetical protein
MDDVQVVDCPHCGGSFVVIEAACRIFRHGVLKNGGTQVNPHASKEECEYLIQNDLIWGCGKPFQIILSEDGVYRSAVVCDYI